MARIWSLSGWPRSEKEGWKSLRPSRLDSSRVTASSAVSQASFGSIRLPPFFSLLIEPISFLFHITLANSPLPPISPSPPTFLHSFLLIVQEKECTVVLLAMKSNASHPLPLNLFSFYTYISYFFPIFSLSHFIYINIFI